MLNLYKKGEKIIIFLLVSTILNADILIASATEGRQINSDFNKKYHFEEVGMTLTLPKDWYVFTEDNLEGNPNYAAVNSDEEKMKKLFASNYLLFDCLEEEGKKELSCAVSHSFKSNRIINMKNMNLAGLNEQGKSLVSYDHVKDGKNIKYTSYEILDNELRFMVLNGILIDPNDLKTELAEFIQYTTIVNGENITFQYYSYNEEISPQDRALFETIIFSVDFDLILNEVKYSTDLILKVLGIIAFLILALLSVAWNIRRYRKKSRI